MINPTNIQQAIVGLRQSLSEANKQFDRYWMSGEEWYHPEWNIEKCFLDLLSLTESLGLSETYKLLLDDYHTIKQDKDGFMKEGLTPDAEPYSLVLSTIRKHFGAIEQFYPSETPTTITKDLLQIIRDIHYTITDKELFPHVPKNENDVHIRIEGILKCVFPDLKHKPTLTKQIKNFEPDTGIPSIRTLIEYKYLSRKTDAPTIADQILADTRGYNGPDWKTFLYVVYETNRFRTEKDWIELLRQSGVPENTTVVVLSGEPVPEFGKKKPTEPKRA